MFCPLVGASRSFIGSPLSPTVRFMPGDPPAALLEYAHPSARRVEFATSADSWETRHLMQRRGRIWVIFTTLGMPMLQSGQEFLRSKRGISNTYDRGDEVNALRWTDRERPLAAEAMAYYRGLIHLRQSDAGKAFRVASKPPPHYYQRAARACGACKKPCKRRVCIIKIGRLIMKAHAPGKLILSGEHAVVHGRPALVMAVNRYAHTRIQPIAENTIHLTFRGFIENDDIAIADLPGLKKRLMENYNRFLMGDINIQHVLGRPAELLYYAVIHLLDETKRNLESGLHITLTTNLPIGCGMGSSAAVIAAVLGGVTELLRIKLDRDGLYQLTLDVEKLQHGHPSGVDPYIIVHGGFVRFLRGKAKPLAPLRKPMHLALTGAPESSTGACVARVAQAHPVDDPIWMQFERVTNGFERALRREAWGDVREAVRANHRLLVRIGVVPPPVQSFIEEIEASGGAGKVCGAGAIAGDAAGVVLVVEGEKTDAVRSRYNYEYFPVQPETKGLTVVSE